MQSKVILVLGKRGSGKTYFTKTVILKRIRRPIFIFDPLGEYPGTKLNLKQIIAYIRKRKLPAIINFFSESDQEEEAFYRLIYKLGNCSLVMEEADIYTNPQYISPGLANLLKRGRHKNIDMVFITRRPAEINRLVSAQATTIISFFQNEPRDLQWLKIWAGQESIKVQNLQPYEYEIFGEQI